MSVLEQFNLSAPFHYFEEISKIPHGSGDMERISNYCKKFAEDRGHRVIQDEDFNILIFKDATPGYENVDTIILQGHMDMVCEKVAGSNFDFKKDSLELDTDGINIWAKGTTLGADNGIAIAMCLAILDDKNMQHGPLEMIFTVDEENGLNGAASVDLSSLKGKKMINLDSEEDHMILTSCAGGAVIFGNVTGTFEGCQGMEYTLVLEGLKGGHSGIEIHKELGNAHVLLGRVLHHLDKQVTLNIITAQGGTLPNVIPNRAEVRILIQENQEVLFLAQVKEIESIIQNELMLNEKDFRITITKGGKIEEKTLTSSSKQNLLNGLMNFPSGVQHRSLSIEGLVETSLNMGVFHMKDGVITYGFNIRSAKESAKKYLMDRLTSMIEFMDGEAVLDGEYPGWEYRVESSLRDMAVEVYRETFHKEAEIGAVHAGLECGLFMDKIKDLDCISIGPNLKQVHSVNESMEIASVERVWKFLQNILATQ